MKPHDHPLPEVRDGSKFLVDVPHTPLSLDIDCTFHPKMEAHMYGARALPHCESLYPNNKDDLFHEGSEPSYTCSNPRLCFVSHLFVLLQVVK